jgi:hypothetical protein
VARILYKLLFSATVGEATTYHVTQLTNHSFDDIRAQVSGENIVWVRDERRDDAIFSAMPKCNGTIFAR